MMQNIARVALVMAIATIVIGLAIYPTNPIVTGTFRQGVTGVLVAFGLVGAIAASAFGWNPCRRFPVLDNVNSFADAYKKLCGLVSDYAEQKLIQGDMGYIRTLLSEMLRHRADLVKEAERNKQLLLAVEHMNDFKRFHRLARAFDITPDIGYEKYFENKA